MKIRNVSAICMSMMILTLTIHNVDARQGTSTDQQRVQGTWTVIQMVVQGEQVDTFPKGRRPVAQIHDDELTVTMDDLKLRFRFEMAPDNHAANAVRWWGRFDSMLEGVVESNGWYLFEPITDQNDLELLAIHVGPPARDRIGKHDRAKMSFLMARTANTRLADTLLRTPLKETSAQRLGGLAGLQGKWKVESVDGKRISDDVVHEFRNNRFRKPLQFSDGSGGVVIEATVTLNEKSTPRRIDYEFVGIGRLKGIYKLADNRLTICMARFKKPRPTTFMPNKTTDASVVIYRKLTAEEAKPKPVVQPSG